MFLLTKNFPRIFVCLLLKWLYNMLLYSFMVAMIFSDNFCHV